MTTATTILSKNITIATITLARTMEEANTLQKALQALAAHQLPVTIADGGSTPSFIHFLSSIPHFTLAPQPTIGLLAQAKKSLQLASQQANSFIFYTEPDKKKFFQDGLVKFLSATTRHLNSGIVLASRSTNALASFAAFQQKTEKTINTCCEEIIGKATDYTYGPFLLQKEMVAYVEALPDDIGWGWRPYLFALAHRLGLTIESIVGDYYCPVDQQSDNAQERIYRMKQLEQNVRGLVLGATLQLPAL